MKKQILAVVIGALMTPMAQAGVVRLAAKGTFHAAKFGVKVAKVPVKALAKIVF